jgi:hypothetical protein
VRRLFRISGTNGLLVLWVWIEHWSKEWWWESRLSGV